MYQVLIVDDEARERNIIKILLERQYTKMFEFYEANNGEAAIYEFEKNQPQLIIIDIRMPGMDGIEAIKRIRNQSLDIYIIIITAYDYFEFAKEAIKNGVNDFILKPPSRDNFNQAINKFFKYIQKRELNKKNVEEAKEKLEHWMSIMKKDMAISLAYGGLEEHIDGYFSMLDISYHWGACILFSLDHQQDTFFRENRIDENIYLKKISRYIDEFMKKQLLQYITGIQGKNVIMFLFLKEKDRDISHKTTLEISSNMLGYVQRNCNLTLKVGIGRGYLLSKDLSKSYEEALTAIKNKKKSYDNKPIYVYTLEEHKIENNNDCCEKLIVKKIREGNRNEVSDILVEVFTFLKNKYSNEQMTFKVRLIEFLSSITKSCLGKEYTSSNLNDLAPLIGLNEFHEIIKFTQRFVEKLLEQVKEQQNNKRHFIIDEVVEYVNENYHLPICVEETAQKFSLSPFYFSKLFKEYQNINFVDFITEIRIKKAIELFANESLNIKEIAYQVGYRDANYFSRVFKKTIGMSPKDYRNKFFI